MTMPPAVRCYPGRAIATGAAIGSISVLGLNAAGVLEPLHLGIHLAGIAEGVLVGLVLAGALEVVVVRPAVSLLRKAQRWRRRDGR